MSFLPEHINPIALTLATMGLAAFLDRRRAWLVGLPALIGITIGFVLDTVGASLRVVPLVPFVVEVATVAMLGGVALSRRGVSMLY